MLKRFQGTSKIKDVGGWMEGPILQAFPVKESQRATYLGNEIDLPAIVWQDGDVSLTNDEHTAEWIIEGHLGGGRTIGEMKENVRKVFAMRKEVHLHLQKSQKFFEVAGDEIAIKHIDAPLKSDIFLCNLHDSSSGAAQITVKYENKATLARISEVNISKHLEGGPISNDIEYLAGKGSSQANKLLSALAKSSMPLSFPGKTYLTSDDMGLVKLMILGDTLAALLTRYVADGDAHTHEKNMQRYFPKSKRPHYVHALAGEELSHGLMAMLRVQLVKELKELAAIFMKFAAFDQLELQYILSKEHTEKTGGQQAGKLTELAGQLLEAQLYAKKGGATGSQILALETAIFGEELSEFHARLRQVIEAYTELPNEQKHSAVVSSKGYAKLDLKTEKPGGVYELRDREVPMGEENLEGIFQALEILLKVAI
jgi:hypothetical protein